MAKRAVVVGVNDYSVWDPTGGSDLSYCVSDAQSMYHLLIDAFGFDAKQVFYYTDANATRSNILKALNYITAQGAAGDVSCFFFAGHGTQIRADSSKADCDSYYEAIMPFSGDCILDYDLGQIADALEPSYVNFSIILDSCHSGGMHKTDELQKCRSPIFSSELINVIVKYLKTLIPCGICLPEANLDALKNNVSNVKDSGKGVIDLDPDPDKTLIKQSKSTLISACKYSEVANEHGGFGHGFLTQAFLDLVNQSNFLITYDDLLSELRAKVEKYVKDKLKPTEPWISQTPQLRGQMNRMEENFLAGWTQSK